MNVLDTVKGRVTFDLNKAMEFVNGVSKEQLRLEIRKRLLPIIDQLLDEAVEEVAGGLETTLETYFSIHKGTTDIYFTVKDKPRVKNTRHSHS